mmetsp:Transcript_91533/g.182410  ORF Transcript_91533/g.182410 Transcript_91533/m.182410 type:complete len:293 (-) Transcript_91533:902-1780(-)
MDAGSKFMIQPSNPATKTTVAKRRTSLPEYSKFGDPEADPQKPEMPQSEASGQEKACNNDLATAEQSQWETEYCHPPEGKDGGHQAALAATVVSQRGGYQQDVEEAIWENQYGHYRCLGPSNAPSPWSAHHNEPRHVPTTCLGLVQHPRAASRDNDRTGRRDDQFAYNKSNGILNLSFTALGAQKRWLIATSLLEKQGLKIVSSLEPIWRAFIYSNTGVLFKITRSAALELLMWVSTNQRGVFHLLARADETNILYQLGSGATVNACGGGWEAHLNDVTDGGGRSIRGVGGA